MRLNYKMDISNYKVGYMLGALFGSTSVERILLFLFVNGRCYGTQLHKVFKTALTPLQKALCRLEKEGVIMSYLEGKVRLYQLNPLYPLLDELELLLKKAYTLLSPQDKRSYFAPKNEGSPFRHNKLTKEKLLDEVWGRLQAVRRVAFQATCHSKESGGMSGKGVADVLVTRLNENVLVFTEKGSWKAKKTGELNCSNTLRWTKDDKSHKISLDHLRRGWDAPVFLFDLVPYGKKTLISLDSHLCGADYYFGHIKLDETKLCLYSRVIGAKKNDAIDYLYSCL